MSPVRNVGRIGRSGRRKPIPGFVWVPPTDGAIFKVEIVTDSTTYDVTDEIIEGEYTDGITETIGNFSFTIDNSVQQYANAFSIYDQLNIYMNYGSTASILKFAGLVERPSKKDHKIILTGQSSALRAVGKNVTYSTEDTTRSDALIEIINKYFTGVITTNNVEADSDLITVSYEDKPFWEIVQEFCAAGGRDAYIDASFDFNYFESGSRINTTDAAIHEFNLIDTGDFSPDLQGVINRVIVYGRKSGDTIILATANDIASQNNLKGDIRELIINDNNIVTVQQAQDRADFELATNKDPPIVGEVTSLLLPTLSPGELVRISDPLNGINPGNYAVQSYIHQFSNDNPPQTILVVQKERTSIPIIFKKRIKFETEIGESNNPNEMEHSIAFDFFTDVGSHSNTEIDTNLGILKTDGSSSGIWTSDITTTNDNVTAIEIRIAGRGILNSIQASLDGGNSYTNIGQLNTSVTSIPLGKQIRVRLDLGSSTTEITLLNILYKIT